MNIRGYKRVIKSLNHRVKESQFNASSFHIERYVRDNPFLLPEDLSAIFPTPQEREIAENYIYFRRRIAANSPDWIFFETPDPLFRSRHDLLLSLFFEKRVRSFPFLPFEQLIKIVEDLKYPVFAEFIKTMKG